MPREAIHRWLIAETTAWPLVSASASRLRLTALERLAPGALGRDTDTRRLADELQRWLRPRASGWSLDSLALLRQRLWFDCDDRHVPLIDFATRLASRHLAFSGPRVILRVDPPGSDHGPDAYTAPLTYEEQLSRWHWLCRSLPTDLLIAALGSADHIEPTTGRVTLGSPEIARVLEKPVAETHLHVGAAVPFPALWCGLMASAAELDPEHGKLARLEQPPFGSPHALVAMLRAAAIVRAWMGFFLRWRHDTGRSDDFTRFFRDSPGQHIAERLLWPSGADAAQQATRRAFDWLLTGPQNQDRVQRGTAEMASLARHIAILCRARSSEGSGDPLEWLWPAGASPVSAELRQTCRAMDYLRGPGRADHAFAELFWQYQRMRGQIFRYLVQEPGTRGLDWFSEHYHRISALRRPVDGDKYRLALDTQSQGLHLASFEARTAPETTWNETWDEIQSFARQAGSWLAERVAARSQLGDRSATEMGLVLHFVKRRVCVCGRLHADPRHRAFSARHGAWFHSEQVKAEALKQLLHYAPECLLLLRGLDVANLELAIPTWVTVPLLRDVRIASGETARELMRRYPHLASTPIEPLRMTCHAGEEFRSIHEGLRRVHELIEFGVLERGDRLGHGLVLGTEVAAWGRACAYAVQPAGERLDDLVWEWDRYARGQVTPPAGREVRIRQEIIQVARGMYGRKRGRTWGIDELAEARRLRHRPRALHRLGYPDCRHEDPGLGPEIHLLWRYLTDGSVYERGCRPLEIQLSEQELDAVARLQTWLRGEIARLAITIESNPTSNTVIAELLDVTRHPSFVMQPVDSQPGSSASLDLSINTDNPLTFATCLSDEYTYLHAALLRGGISAGRASEWLDRARCAGWNSRFTHPASADPQALAAVAHALER